MAFKKWTSLIVLSLIFSLGCSEDEKKQQTVAPTKPEVEKPTDLKDLPLADALRTKYQTLMLTCQYDYQIVRETKRGSDSVGVLVWNILDDYRNERWTDFDQNMDNVKSNYQFNIELSLEDVVTSYRNENGDSVGVRLKNAATIRGEFQSTIEETGQSVVSQGPIPVNFYDRVPVELTNIRFSPSKNANHESNVIVTCQLSAKVKAGYENDYELITP